MSDQEIIRNVVEECNASFAAHDVTGYARIKEMLEDIEVETPAVVSARRLADAGPEMSSPRFAYPHIQSMLTE